MPFLLDSKMVGPDTREVGGKSTMSWKWRSQRGSGGPAFSSPMEELEDGGGDACPVKRPSPPPDLIEENEALDSGMAQDVCQFHLSTMNVLLPPVRSSEAPTRVKIRSQIPTCAYPAGT